MARLLAGPMLRRTEPERAWLWFATEGDSAISATAYDAGGAEIGRSPAGGQKSARLGDNLSVHLVPLEPDGDTFPEGEIIRYDVDVDGDNIAALGLDRGEAGITYGDERLPSFYLPEGRQLERFAHGSCRKLHGAGTDAYRGLDARLTDTVGNLGERPAMLFLTGDQIYADDVAGPLIKHLTKEGDRLMGRVEQLPAPFETVRTLPVYGRGERVREAGFTSDHADNHVAGFGEFAVLYLAAWSPAGWPDEGLPAAPDAPLTSAQQERYDAERGALEAAREDAATVRRVHANVPVLTIFDDHEVTDDWNLTRNWRTNVRNNPLGRRIVANGLAAYWAFQGWGNDPDAFDTPLPLIDTIVDRNTRDDFDDTLWNFTGWSYALPTIPTVIALDTRTQRRYDEPDEAARLMDANALERLTELWNEDGMGPGGSLILLSGAPIFGFDFVEDAQRLAASARTAVELDHENWYGNKNGYAALMTVLTDEMEPNHCIVLSGDVHYSFSNDADFFCKGKGLRVTQLTASAFKNESGFAGVIRTFGNIATKVETRVGALPDVEGPSTLEMLTMPDRAEGWRGPAETNGEPIWYDRTRSVGPDGDGNHHVTTASFGEVQIQFYNAVGEDIVGPGIAMVYHTLHAAPATGEAAVTFTHDGPARGYIPPDDD